MSKSGSQSSTSEATDGLYVRLTEFLATLAKAGYSKKTRDDKRRAIASFIRWARDGRITIDDLDETHVRAFLSRRSRPRWKHRHPARAALHQFLTYLESLEVVRRHDSEGSPAEDLVRRYLDHLRTDRGLCVRSLEVYSLYVRPFIVTQQLPARMGSLSALAVRSYFLDRGRGRSISFLRLLTAALRSFLHYLFLAAELDVDLATAVPPVRQWRFTSVPPFLTAQEVERVIAAVDRSTARGRRAFAMVLLLARLGLRAGEVVALELDDICWGTGEIIIRGKGRRRDRLPLLADVGDALALYLRERGPSASRRVFLRSIAPRVGLSGPSAVGAVARKALRGAGLRLPGRVGAHVFRHGLATRMIRHGASLAEISQVLRHDCIASTQLYAKVEFEALRGVALPWPSPEVSQ